MRSVIACFFLGIAIAWLAASNICLRNDLQITVDALVELQNIVINIGEHDMAMRKRLDDHDALIRSLLNGVADLQK